MHKHELIIFPSPKVPKFHQTSMSVQNIPTALVDSWSFKAIKPSTHFFRGKWPLNLQFQFVHQQWAVKPQSNYLKGQPSPKHSGLDNNVPILSDGVYPLGELVTRAHLKYLMNLWFRTLGNQYLPSWYWKSYITSYLTKSIVIISPFFFKVGGFNHLEKYEFVNGKDDIPYMKWKIYKCSKPPTSYI
jgi:hypothetical protein